MEKVVRDGKVAVLYSPGYGAGWYSWNEGCKKLIFDPVLVEIVESGIDMGKIEERVKDLYPKESIYTGGADQLEIAWVPEGIRFLIEEYDGWESLTILGPESGFVA